MLCAMALLSVRGLVRRPWFDGLELELAAGELRVVHGASGVGKTLLLRALADLDPIEAGELALDGVGREQMAPARWRAAVCYVPAGEVRFVGTALDNAARATQLGLHAGRVPRCPEGLDPGAPAAQLSSGELQRLALERALSLEPRVLLLDEPTAHLDPERARAVERRLSDWCAEGGAILCVSHDPELATRLGAGAPLHLERA